VPVSGNQSPIEWAGYWHHSCRGRSEPFDAKTFWEMVSPRDWLYHVTREMTFAAIGLRSCARQLERNGRSLNKLAGALSRWFAVLPHETLLRPAEPFIGRRPEGRSARKRASNTGIPLVSLQFRESPTVHEVVTDLSECLRLCHRKRIEWIEPTTPHTEYVFLLVNAAY
jgi:hypothetical protein